MMSSPGKRPRSPENPATRKAEQHLRKLPKLDTYVSPSPLPTPAESSSSSGGKAGFRFAFPSPKKPAPSPDLEQLNTLSPSTPKKKTPQPSASNTTPLSSFPISTNAFSGTTSSLFKTASHGANNYPVRHLILSNNSVLPEQAEIILIEFPQNFYDESAPKPPVSTVPGTTLSNEDGTHLGLVWKVKKYDTEASFIFDVFPIVSYPRAIPNSIDYVKNLPKNSKEKHIPLLFTITGGNGALQERDVTDLTPSSFGAPLDTGDFINSRASWVYVRKQKIIMRAGTNSWHRLPTKPKLPFPSLQRLIEYEDDLHNTSLLRAQGESEDCFRNDEHDLSVPAQIGNDSRRLADVTETTVSPDQLKDMKGVDADNTAVSGLINRYRLVKSLEVKQGKNQQPQKQQQHDNDNDDDVPHSMQQLQVDGMVRVSGSKLIDNLNLDAIPIFPSLTMEDLTQHQHAYPVQDPTASTVYPIHELGEVLDPALGAHPRRHLEILRGIPRPKRHGLTNANTSGREDKNNYKIICEEHYYPETSMIEELRILGLHNEMKKLTQEHERAVNSSINNWLDLVI